MNGLLGKITDRTAGPEDITYSRNSVTFSNIPACGLGQSRLNRLSTLRYFADEYKAHIEVVSRLSLRKPTESVMSPASTIKTLKIDGRDFSARQDETVWMSPGRIAFHPHAL
jgi:hypothetical protein